MKTSYSKSLLILSTLGASIVALAGCSDRDRREARENTREAVADTRATTREGWTETKAATQSAAAEVGAAAANTWNQLSNYSYDRRAEFRTGLKRMVDQLDDQTDDLKDSPAAKSSGAKAEATLKYREARADLRRAMDKLDGANSDNWDKVKSGIADAWDRVQTAYRNVRAEVRS